MTRVSEASCKRKHVAWVVVLVLLPLPTVMVVAAAVAVVHLSLRTSYHSLI